MIEFAEVSIGTGDVLACCRCAAAVDARPFAADEVIASVAQAATRDTRPGPNLALAGFEPFRHPSLPALIAACAATGAERIMVRTDAAELGYADNAAGCLSAGVRLIEVVRLADGPRHDALSGRQGLAEASEAGVAAFRRAAEAAGAHIAVFGAVPACRHNAADLASAVVALARMGASAVRIEAQALPEGADNQALLESAVHTGAVNRVAVSVTGWAGPLGAFWGRQPYLLRGGER